MVCLDEYNHREAYALYYRHCDGYPEGLGLEIVNCLKRMQKEEKAGFFEPTHENIYRRIVSELMLEDQKRFVKKPEDAFLTVQGDLEWIYVIGNFGTLDRVYVEVYKTSNLRTDRDFVFRCYGCYVQYFSEKIEQQLEQISLTCGTVLNVMEAYEKAKVPVLEEVRQ